MPRKSKPGSRYPDDWKALALQVKEEAGWKCTRCNHPHDPASGHTLTIHHLDMDRGNCRWWNLIPLCQKCHLQIQHKVILERSWIFSHSSWFKPYVAGYYANINELDDSRPVVEAEMDRIIEQYQLRV